MMIAPRNLPPASPPRTTRTVVAGAVGNILEWYDFALFAFFAPVIGQLFFPSSSRLASLLDAFGVFALGFLMRPVGGLIFGHLGDRVGRKRALELSVLLMAIPTTLVGLLPTYDQIGATAPILLTVIRMLQGISVGGEYIGSLAFLGEHAPPGRRGFLASWTTFSAGLGNLLGSGVAALVTGLVPPEALTAWAWRIPFLAAASGGVVGLWLRRGIAESPLFQQAAAAGNVARTPLRDALRQEWRPILATAGLAMMMSVGFYLPWVWLPTWLAHINQPPMAQGRALTINTICMSVMLLLNPISGALSDRLGRKALLAAGSAAYVLLAFPLFLLLQRGTAAAALTAQLCFAVASSLVAGASPAAYVELFPTRTRYSGIAIGYNGTLALLGGTTPWVATALIGATGYNLAPALYLIAAAGINLLTALRIEDRFDQPLS